MTSLHNHRGTTITTLLGTLLILVHVIQAQDNPLPNLHTAAVQGNVAVIQQHIEAGTDLDMRDAFGSTPLSASITFGRTESAKVLIEGGADLSLTDQYGSAPLHLAALFGRSQIANALVQAGADKYVLTNNGATPYDIAAASFDQDTLLLKGLQQQLRPFGLELNLDTIREHRKEIAARLRPQPEALRHVDVTPPRDTPWPIENIADPELRSLVAELIYDSQHCSNIKSVIILRDGQILTEKYFNGQKPDQLTIIQSITKSYFATLVGIAIDKGCISGLDAKMINFFPEFKEQLSSGPKKDITIRHLLQMRAGYPWEELDPEAWERFIEGTGQYAMIADYPLANEPGAEFNYSNLSNYILGIIVARACDQDLHEFAITHLLDPIGSGHGEWYQDTLGNYYSLLSFTPRDVAMLGQLYLNEGLHEHRRIVSEQWCKDALGQYSNDAWVLEKSKQNIGRYLHDLNYGYQWWSADIAGHRIPFAWGHGGQMVFILQDLNMVVAIISDPQWRQHNPEAWKAEQSSFNLAGKFLTNLLHR